MTALSGCALSTGAESRDGQDLNIYDIYEATNAEREKEGLAQLGFLEFISQYLNYQFDYDEDKNFQTVINRSLLSSVGIVVSFSSGLSSKSYAGAGVIVELDKEAGNAYVLTNAHIVFKKDATPQTAQNVRIYLYGNDVISLADSYIDDVKIVNYSISYDLALLKIENSKLIQDSDVRAAVFSENENVYAGEKVYTIGYPGGTGISVSSGIISKDSEFIALDFAVDTNIKQNLYRVMRTDAGVNSGNSGGALYDNSGRIVGIINSKDPSAENENMGYALCASYAKRIFMLMKDGYKIADSAYGIRHAVFPAEYTYTSEAYFDNDTGLTEIRDTVYILLPYGGFRTGDIVKHIKVSDAEGATVEDMDVTRFYNLDDLLISARDGGKITFTVNRNGAEMQINFTPQFENFY